MDEYEYVRRVLALVDPYALDEILWTVEGGVVRFQVGCSDCFYWGTADCEEVTPQSVAELERAYADIRSIDASLPPHDWTDKSQNWRYHLCSYSQMLYAARQRQLRPQKPVLDKLPPELRSLFEAFGPERSE